MTSYAFNIEAVMAGRKRTALKLVVWVLLVLGAIVAAWGLDDWRGFFAHPARAGVVVVVLLGLIPVLAGLVDVEMFRKGRKPVGRQRWLLAGLLLIGISLAVFLPYADRRSILTFADLDAVRYVGLVLYTLGNVLALLALRALGKQYSGYITLQENHELVQTGIYGVIRHPIYLRALLVSVGVPLIFRSRLLFPFLLFIAVFVCLRIRQEERLLAEEFGAEFEAYRRRTWRLLPYVY